MGLSVHLVWSSRCSLVSGSRLQHEPIKVGRRRNVIQTEPALAVSGALIFFPRTRKQEGEGSMFLACIYGIKAPFKPVGLSQTRPTKFRRGRGSWTPAKILLKSNFTIARDQFRTQPSLVFTTLALSVLSSDLSAKRLRG
ncbi:hypothetical protein BaRGS_00031656 [Batillaria attramentaria]|uniref:Uncharacterized protein n=1 Tax=Batillaria attramentaria TaxID=370345 RepID=A0ABD0JQX8_9CAEN